MTLALSVVLLPMAPKAFVMLYVFPEGLFLDQSSVISIWKSRLLRKTPLTEFGFEEKR